MIVVADTSPINYLIQLGHIDFLQQLYKRIVIPHAVLDELLNPKAPAPVRAWALNPPGWLEFATPSASLVMDLDILDRGEAEAIVLAGEIDADWLLIDEAMGRDQAIAKGLKTIGTLGFLRELARLQIFDLRAEIIRLQGLGFYVSDSLIQALLASFNGM